MSNLRPREISNMATKSTFGVLSPKRKDADMDSRHYCECELSEPIKMPPPVNNKDNRFTSNSSIQRPINQVINCDLQHAGQKNTNYFLRKAIEESRSMHKEDSLFLKNADIKKDKGLIDPMSDGIPQKSALIPMEESQKKLFIKGKSSGVDSRKDLATFADPNVCSV